MRFLFVHLQKFLYEQTERSAAVSSLKVQNFEIKQQLIAQSAHAEISASAHIKISNLVFSLYVLRCASWHLCISNPKNEVCALR